MKRVQIQRPVSETPRQTEKTALRRQAAWAAGTESFQNRDPVYHVTEDFHQTFDAIGRQHAAALADKSKDKAENTEDFSVPDSQSSRSFYECSSPEEQAMLQRFSETAFQRGTLSGAVLAGTGQMMLVSCLRKTVCQSQPDKWQQRKLFDKASQQRNIPGHSPDKVIFNRNFANSAVGLVIDTLRDARRTVESMRDLALGKSEMGMAGADTLLTMYPFLDDSRERELLGQYLERLKTEKSPDMHAALQSAAGHMQALIAKKAQMKQEFINKLRFLSDRATEALEIFEAPGYAEQLSDASKQQQAAGEGDGDGDGEADKNSRNEDEDTGNAPAERLSGTGNGADNGADTAGNPERSDAGDTAAEIPEGTGRAARKQRNGGTRKKTKPDAGDDKI